MTLRSKPIKYSPRRSLMKNSALINEIDGVLSEKHIRLHFSDYLEARFKADISPERSRNLFIAGLICLGVYDSFLISDFLFRPDFFSEIAWLRLGVVSLPGLLALLLIRRGIPQVFREGVIAGLTVLATTVSCHIFYLTGADSITVFDPFAFSLIVVASNIVVALRFKYALISTLICFVIMSTYIVSLPIMPEEGRFFFVIYSFGVSVFTLYANYKFEIGERRTYLLFLREVLRSMEIKKDNQFLTLISQSDPLTGLANRRHYDEFYQHMWGAGCTSSQHIGMLIIDIDNFKSYNDYYGHPEGDNCLIKVAKLLKNHVRKENLVARIGGEEFSILIPNAILNYLVFLAEGIRTAVEGLAIPHAGAGEHSVVTVSIGIAIGLPSNEMSTAKLIRDADEALYLAKRSGRNKHCYKEAG